MFISAEEYDCNVKLWIEFDITDLRVQYLEHAAASSTDTSATWKISTLTFGGSSNFEGAERNKAIKALTTTKQR
jgi:hypothetical protein